MTVSEYCRQAAFRGARQANPGFLSGKFSRPIPRRVLRQTLGEVHRPERERAIRAWWDYCHEVLPHNVHGYMARKAYARGTGMLELDGGSSYLPVGPDRSPYIQAGNSRSDWTQPGERSVRPSSTNGLVTVFLVELSYWLEAIELRMSVRNWRLALSLYCSFCNPKLTNYYSARLSIDLPAYVSFRDSSE